MLTVMPVWLYFSSFLFFFVLFCFWSRNFTHYTSVGCVWFSLPYVYLSISFSPWGFSSLFTLQQRKLRCLAFLKTFFWFFCCYLPARLFRNFTFNYRKKAKKKSRKRSNIVQFGRWRDSFSSALCSILSWSTLFQPMTVRVISELYYNFF